MSLSLEGHTTRAFDGDLSSLHVQAVAMGALVIEQVQLAVNAYSGWDRSAATLVLDRERKINLYDAEIEEAALQVIARRQPMAQDLRAVIAIDKVVTEHPEWFDFRRARGSPTSYRVRVRVKSAGVYRIAVPSSTYYGSGASVAIVMRVHR